MKYWPLICSLAFGASAVVGCSSASPSNGSAEDSGRLGVHLDVAPGVTLNSVTYTITGNGFTKTGSIDVSGAPMISGTIGGIPAGNGYSLTLTATSTSGATFSGSATFNVSASGTTSVTIHLKGSTKSGNGNVSVNGTFNVGPVIDELTVTPLQVFTGSSITLKSVASDPDNAPSPLTYYWSSTGGVLGDPIGANTTLSSDSPGSFDVKLTIFDGETSATVTTTVTFVEREDGAGGAGGEGGGGTGPAQPNVLFIIADDLGAESLSLYPELVGSSGAVPTPNLEALAERGLVFDNAWSSPACSPTRGTILSGQYAHRNGVTTVGATLPTNTVTLFDRLTADAPGYAHALFGKYHLAGGNSSNLDPRAGVAYPQAPGILQHIRDIGITNFKGFVSGGIDDYFNWVTWDTNAPAIANTSYAATGLTDLAIDYIDEQADHPWFLYQSYNSPHFPNQVPPRELHSVDLSSIGNPAPGAVSNTVPNYKAMIQSLDTELGRLLENVDLDTTTVIFLGDNGTPANVKDTGTGVRGSKGSVYQGGVNVPLIVAGAGVTRRGREDALVVSSDIYATVLSLAGVPVTQVGNSYSFKPLLGDEAATNGRVYAYSEIGANAASRIWTIRDSRYKLLYTARQFELYDVVADPLETTNLYGSAQHAAARNALETEIAALKAAAPAGAFFP